MEVSVLSRQALVTWVAQQIERREPGAVVRFGDTEADVLDAMLDDDDLMVAARRKLEAQTGLPLSPDDVMKVRCLLEQAFEGADVLGILFGQQLTPQSENSLTHRYRRHAGASGNTSALASCQLHNDLLAALPPLLAGRRIGVISCRDLRSTLVRSWRLEDATIHQVPSEPTVRDVDGAYEAALHGTPIWPDRHRELRSELLVHERGEVFLVGAGPFGKDLCIRIRERGGLALDLGSALDQLAGKITRGPLRRALLLHRQGMTAVDIAAHLQDRYGAPVDPTRVESLIGNPALFAAANPHDLSRLSSG